MEEETRRCEICDKIFTVIGRNTKHCGRLCLGIKDNLARGATQYAINKIISFCKHGNLTIAELRRYKRVIHKIKEGEL